MTSLSLPELVGDCCILQGNIIISPVELHSLFETQLSGRFMWPVSKDFCIHVVVRYFHRLTFASITAFLFWQHLAFKLCHNPFVFDLLGSSLL